MKKIYISILILFLFHHNIVSGETFLSLKKNKVNVRYGPSFDSPIKYIYKIEKKLVESTYNQENSKRFIIAMKQKLQD